MDLTVSLDDNLAAEVCKIAAEQETTVPELIGEYLRELVAKRGGSEYYRRLQALDQSFRSFESDLGEGTWSRADLHDRS